MAPKGAAGKRTVSIPAASVPDIREHLKRYAEPGAGGRAFVGAKGAPPRRNHFHRLWHKACADAEIKGLPSTTSGARATPSPRRSIRARALTGIG
jgi:hypothetical protein